jgi:hypothetical protein
VAAAQALLRAGVVLKMAVAAGLGPEVDMAALAALEILAGILLSKGMQAAEAILLPITLAVVVVGQAP